MKSIVSYKNRGIGGDNAYRGNCSPRLLVDLIEHYRLKEISDYMCGSNTTGDVAAKLHINSNTYDLNKGFDLIKDDIKEKNNFVFWHPPYWDIIKYSGYMYGDKPIKNDISHIRDYQDFMRVSNELLLKQFASLKTGGRLAILMADVKKNRVLYSMLLDFIKPGTVEQIVIKEQHNCWSYKKHYSNNNFIPIIHEYLLILRRDNPFIENLKVTKDYRFDIRDSKLITWKEIIYSVLENKRKPTHLSEIYEAVSSYKKAKSNIHYEAKVRQTLNRYDIFKKVEKGWYDIAS